MTGDDGAATIWHVVNADELKTFVQLPHTSGNISAETELIQIELVLTASGRRESAQVHDTRLSPGSHLALTRLSWGSHPARTHLSPSSVSPGSHPVLTAL